MGSIKNLDADLGFTVFIDPQLICSSMGKIDDCALLAEFSIVDHHNHTFIGVFARHFHLRPKRQLAVGSRQGVPPKDLTTGGFVSVEARPIPSGPTTKCFSVAGETSWLGWVFSTLLRDQPIATSSTSPTTGDANERVILIGVVKRVGEESMWTSIPLSGGESP